jgi:hypothetical protein
MRTNNTLIRQKLPQLQTAIACVAQTPLESIDITTIATGSTSFPFTKPQGTGAPNCSSSSRGRRLQATIQETTVSFDVLNAPYISPLTFQNDPTLMSLGASGQAAPAPVPAPVPAPTNAGAIYGGILGGLCVIAIASYYGVKYIRSQRARRPVVSRTSSNPKTQATINPFTSNNRISYSPAVVKMSRSNSV